MNAVVPNAWLSAPAAAAVSFRAAPVSVIVPPLMSAFSALRSTLRIGTRVPPTSAVSSGVASTPISKSVSWTVVAPLVSEIPPLWVIVPANVLASSLPPVIGKASESRADRRGGDAEARAARSAAPGSSVTVVAPPVSAIVLGLAVTATVPSRRPFLNSVVWKVALSALAAALGERDAHAGDAVSSPERAILALRCRASGA